MTVLLRGSRARDLDYGTEGLPNPCVGRSLSAVPGSVEVPGSLLFSELSDLAVLLWLALRRCSACGAAETDYAEMAHSLNLDFLPRGAVEQRLGPPVRALLRHGWLTRDRGRYRFVYEAIRPESSLGDQTALLRPQELTLLHTAAEERTVTSAHLADFARWQIECAGRGWTAASPRELSERWRMSPSTLRRRRRELTGEAAGLLLVQSRGAFPAITWIKELAGLVAPGFEDMPGSPVIAASPPGTAKGGQGSRPSARATRPRNSGSPVPSSALLSSHSDEAISLDVPEQLLRLHRFLLGASAQDQSLTLGQIDVLVDGRLPPPAYSTAGWWTNFSARPQSRAWRVAGRLAQFDERTQSVHFRTRDSMGLSGAELASRRERRRHNAVAVLAAGHRSTVSSEYLRPHWVYQLHLGDEHRFKIGISKSPSLRLHRLAAGRSAAVVDLVELENRFIAEIVECDALRAVRPWQQFGDRDHPAGGFSEMWSDDGPTVALDHLVETVRQEIYVAVARGHVGGLR